MTFAAAPTFLAATKDSTFGTIFAARRRDAASLAAIFIANTADEALSLFHEAFLGASVETAAGDLHLSQALTVLTDSVRSDAAVRHLSLDVTGTVFQKQVWRALRDIPLGETWTYSELADHVGLPNGARAVARACASNRHALAIPCHRIVRGDGTLSGYRWGVERKRDLLARERDAREARETFASRPLEIP